MNRSGLLHRCEVVHPRKIGLDVARQRGGHDRIDRFPGLPGLTVHRQDKGAGSPCRAILVGKQWIERRQRRLAVARYAHRQRIIARQRTVAWLGGQRGAIVALRRSGIASEIVGQRPLAEICALARAARFGLAKIAQRLVGATDRHHCRAKRGFDAGLTGQGILGARQKA